MLKFLIFLAKRAGRVSSFFARLQTKILTYAQMHYGWQPDDEAGAQRLARRQFQLFNYRQAKAQRRSLRKSGVKI